MDRIGHYIKVILFQSLNQRFDSYQDFYRIGSFDFVRFAMLFFSSCSFLGSPLRLFVLCVLFSVCVCSLSWSDYSEYTFSDFQREHGKVYNSVEDRDMRRQHFESNVAMIQKHNARSDKTYTMAVNRFADLSKEEMRRYKGYNKNWKGTVHSQHKHSSVFKVSDLPVSVDWRTKGAITPVKNQVWSCFEIYASVAPVWVLLGICHDRVN